MLQDQKVLPDVRNRPLLLRELFSSSTFKNCYESNRGSFRFTHSISDIPMTPSCSLRSFRNWRLVCCVLSELSHCLNGLSNVNLETQLWDADAFEWSKSKFGHPISQSKVEWSPVRQSDGKLSDCESPKRETHTPNLLIDQREDL